jgi:hypothetical protein
MFLCYGDESSDETKQRVFAVSGVVGTEETWSNLQEDWLLRTNGIAFHAKDCESDQGDYRSTPHAENQSLYRDLTTLVAESGLCGWSFAIDLAAQRRVFPNAPDLAYYKGFTEVIEAMNRFATHYAQDVSFAFDSRRESNFNAGILYQMFRGATTIDVPDDETLRFASARDEPRLQVADLVAREAMKALDNQVGPKKRPPRKSWMALYATERFVIEVVGLSWFESLKDQLPRMRQDLQLDEANYLEWLRESGQQHSVTSLLRYIAPGRSSSVNS